MRLLSGQSIPQIPSSDSKNFTPISPQQDVRLTIETLQQIKQDIIRLFPRAEKRIFDSFSLFSPVTRSSVVHLPNRKYTKLTPGAVTEPSVSDSDANNTLLDTASPCSEDSDISSRTECAESTVSNEESSYGAKRQENTSTLSCPSKNLSHNSGVDNEISSFIRRRPTPPAYYRPPGYPVRGVMSCQSSLRQIKEHAPTSFKNEFSTPLPKYPQAVEEYHSQRACLGMKHNTVPITHSEHMELYGERPRQSRDELTKQEERIRGGMEELVPPRRTLGEFYAAEAEGNPMPAPTPPVSPEASQTELLKEEQQLMEVSNDVSNRSYSCG